MDMKRIFVIIGILLALPVVYAPNPVAQPQFLWDKLIPLLFLDIIGNPLIIGLVLVLIFYLITLALRLSFEVQVISMFFVFFIVVIPNYIQSLQAPLLWAVGILVGISLFYMIWGR